MTGFIWFSNRFASLCFGQKKPQHRELIVKFHCRRRKVDKIFAKAFVGKNDLQEANCKVSVTESDIDLVLSKGFWPEYATARLWLTNAEFAEMNGGGRGSEDDYFYD